MPTIKRIITPADVMENKREKKNSQITKMIYTVTTALHTPTNANDGLVVLITNTTTYSDARRKGEKFRCVFILNKATQLVNAACSVAFVKITMKLVCTKRIASNAGPIQKQFG